MDEIAQYNIKRWKALAEANALFTRPFFDLTWDHFVAYVPPWLAIWTRYHPESME